MMLFFTSKAIWQYSVIAEMFTLENGRISVIARGAKKPKSKFFGVLSPFSKLRITYRGRSELKL